MRSMLTGPFLSVEFDVHRWYTIIRLVRQGGTTVERVIGNTFPGEGPSLHDSYEEWAAAADA